MDKLNYELPQEIQFKPLLTRLVRLEDSLARLDERISALAWRAGFAERLLCGEACACVGEQGFLVHREDLVLLDANTYDGPRSYELAEALRVLKVWRQALRADAQQLLGSERPGEAVVLQGDLRNSELSLWHGCTLDVLEDWSSVMHRISDFPPVLASAIACDAWLRVCGGSDAGWRAPFLAALVLKARRKTRAFLLPVDIGRSRCREAFDPSAAFADRIAGIFGWMEASVDHVRSELQRLTFAEVVLRQKLVGRRKSSRLPALVDLFLRRPVVSVPMAAKALRCSPQAVERMITMLGSTPRLLTERRRYRVWGV